MGNNGRGRGSMELRGLVPTPEERWALMRSYLELGEGDLEAMAATVEPLFRRGPDLVKENYDYLARFPETAAVLGWEDGIDEEHLEERRRFFTIWLARLLGLDLSDDMARYMFYAGKVHAGHGPRRIHVPDIFVTGAISRVQADFAATIQAHIADAGVVARALAGWNKVLTMHLDMMLMGYQVARAVDEGPNPVRVTLFGRLRSLVGRQEMVIHTDPNARVADVLRKFFNYYPEARREALEAHPEPLEEGESLWLELTEVYVPRKSWRVLRNGRDLNYNGGFEAPVEAGDEVALFPPGR